MRTHLLALLASAPLLFAATSATGFSINHTTNYDGVGALQTSDTVTVHVFIDSEGAGVATPFTNPGLNIAAVGVLFTSPNLVFTGADAGGAYAYLNYYYPPYNYPPYITPDTGSQSAFALFTFPQPGTGAFTQLGYAYMVPFYSATEGSSAWINWPSPPAGQGQVNLTWVPPGTVPDLSQQTRGSSNTWLGSIVLHVAEITGGAAQTGLFVNGNCCKVRTGDGVEHRAETTVDDLTMLAPQSVPTPTATPTASPTPTPSPTACIMQNPVVTINTTGKSNGPTDNAKVTHAITGNIVDPASLASNAHRIPICRGTPVSIAVRDRTGIPLNAATSAGISCNRFGCTVSNLQAKEKYISRSADGADTDRMTLLPK